MGEEGKQEQPKVEAKPENKAEENKEEKPAEEKPVEEKKEEKPAEEKPAEEKKEEKPTEEKPAEEKKEEPKPPSPCVLFVDLHCVGCAKKIERSIMKMRGVEGVVIDMAKNEVTIKGIVEPQAICNTITKKTKRRANVISPLPAAEGEPIPEVSGPITVELNVNMHCVACAQQLKRKILQMRGVQTVVTEFSTGKVIVSGTMDANKLVEYVYRRTKKQAKIVPQPEPEKKEETKEAEEKPAAEEAKPEETKEEEKPPEEPKKEESGEGDSSENKKEEGGEGENKDEKKEEKGGKEGTEEETKKEENEFVVTNNVDENGMKRMIYYYYPYQPLYVIERIPPPQLFSDENPNACCIL
ncbi:PREDICTED: heavy metal-associated isoprenylated plant protein 9-like isoform X2 [Lupinus angustifolius]|uniref:heavy metal-associated isoprenylated plant protein 9-like isoform X2 n=1 Tax=Lupinus angustifolius TaxID=3871 RepID=UPI00092EFF1F|nr:PREDICTED: heavy metal-associated isoprenylated plant protein 9-like isoform X2 [Lupinus angustifolius]XP_019431901.1 PREDICTED: heavy metal-associated isoprenylated plant protein 9-like isoform X2 [Lupinus angustifolius]